MSAVAPVFRRHRSVADRRWLVVPGVTIIVVLFLVPVGFLIRQSIVDPEGGFSLAYYAEFFGDALYQRVLVRTAVLNAVVALIAAALAYPATLYLATRSGAGARILLGLLTLPLLVGGASLAYGWVIMFARSGPVDRIGVSLFGGSNFVLLNSEAGIVIGLVHILLPFMTFSLLASYDRLDWNAVRAARSLGAGPIQTFLRVTLPMTRPGLITGVAIVFSLGASTFIIPYLIGGARILLMSTLSYQQNVSLLEYGFGSAIALVLVGMTALVVTAVLLFERQAGGQSHE